MALMYYPRPGEILVCDYRGGFQPPEMTKRRPAVVVSPRLRRRADLVGVVPLSTTEPNPVEAYHCRIEFENPLPQPFDSNVMWAKADMVSSVSFDRLDRFKYHAGGQRQYKSGMLSPEQLREIKVAVLCGLGLDSLTIHL